MGNEQAQEQQSQEQQLQPQTSAERAEPIAEKPKSKRATAPKLDAEALINSDAPSLSSADKEQLLEAVKGYATAVFVNLENALTEVCAALAEPVKPPSESVALELVAALVGTITEFVLNDFSAGLFSIAKATLKHVTVEALTHTAEATTQKIGKAVEGGVVSLGERENEVVEAGPPRGRASNKKPVWANPAAKSLVEEFKTRQSTSLTNHKANAIANVNLGAVSKASAHELRLLVDQLDAMKSDQAAETSNRFQHQVVEGWLEFCARASLGDRELDEHDPSRNAMQAATLTQDSAALDADGAIDVTIELPDVIYGVAGLKLESMKAQTGPGTVRTLQHIAPRLLDAKVLRRIWLRDAKGLLGTSCVMVLYPNGSMSIDQQNSYLSAIGSMLPIDRAEDAAPHSDTFQRMGAQQLLNWLRPCTLETVK